jgi:hypothetical protein
VLLFALVACNGSDGGPGPDGTTGDDDDDTVPADACADRPDGPYCDGDVAVTCAGGAVAGEETCADGCVDGACRVCDPPSVEDAAPRALVSDDGPPAPADAWKRLPLAIRGTATLSVQGPFEVLDADGAAVAGDVTDATMFLRATADGVGSLTLAPVAGCEGPTETIALTARAMPRLAGRILDEAPGFDDGGDLFFAGRPLAVDVPAFAFPDRAGDAFDAWLVPHREDWSDGALAVPDAVGPIAAVAGTPVDLGGAPSLGTLSSWDVVADFDRDGALGPGDLVQGADRRPIATVQNLSELGPHPVDTADAVGGSAFIEQRVWWPTDLDQLDPVPLVVISHGNGHDYRWYDDLGTHFASWGYVAMSHRNNTAPGPVAASRTTISNTDALLAALPSFEGGVLDGEIDGSAIVWIGHSRGGEGVVLAWRDLQAGQQTAQNFGAADVVLLSSIAPTLFEGPEQADPGDTPYHLIAGSADGDVTGGPDQPILQYFRIFQGATNQRMVTYVQGADHNDFNCCGIQDSNFQDGAPLIGRPAAQAISRAVHLALLEAHFQGRSELLELVARSPLVAKPYGPDIRIASQYAPAAGESRVIDDFQTAPDPLVSSSGGAVTGDIASPSVGALDDGNLSLGWSDADPMNGMTWSSAGDTRPDQGFVFGWTAGDDRSLTFELTAGDRDLTGYDAVSFRACQGTRHPDTVALADDLTFTVELEDGAGTVATVALAPFAEIPWPFQRGGSGAGRGWVNEFQTVRLPLTAFERAEPTFDLTDVRAVRMRFGAAHGSERGRLGFDDLTFTRELP